MNLNNLTFEYLNNHNLIPILVHIQINIILFYFKYTNNLVISIKYKQLVI